MAHHGGRTSLPRAHRPRAPIMSAPIPLTAPLAPLRPPPTVTLAAPRPETERANNEYVETPIRAAVPSPPPQPPRLQRPPRLVLPLPPPPVTKQPATASYSKEHPECTARPSIMCPECGRCRCSTCQQPRMLPERWLCDEHCLCSADAIIDYISCLCCVKGFYYHCSETDGDEPCTVQPCGCHPEKRTARWSCLAAVSCVLPCLWCYWPLQGCKRVVADCYERHTWQGCRCRPPLATPEKRLLDTSPDL